MVDKMEYKSYVNRMKDKMKGMYNNLSSAGKEVIDRFYKASMESLDDLQNKDKQRACGAMLQKDLQDLLMRSDCDDLQVQLDFLDVADYIKSAVEIKNKLCGEYSAISKDFLTMLYAPNEFERVHEPEPEFVTTNLSHRFAEKICPTTINKVTQDFYINKVQNFYGESKMADNKEEKEHKYVYAFTNVKGQGSKEACDHAFKAQVEGFKNTMGAFLKTAYLCDKNGNKIPMKNGKEFKAKIWFIPKASLEIADPAIKSAIIFEDYKQFLKPHNEIKPLSQEMADKIGTAYSPELGIAARAAFEEKNKKFKEKKQEQHPEVKQAQEKIQAETLSNLNSLAYGGYSYSM